MNNKRFFYPLQNKRGIHRGRKRKAYYRAVVRCCLGKCGWPDIHSIWDDFYYIVAVRAWYEIHNIRHVEGRNEYEEWYEKKHNPIK